eukprot:5142243-Pleurochrysis_carterae.AAC.1
MHEAEHHAGCRKKRRRAIGRANLADRFTSSHRRACLSPGLRLRQRNNARINWRTAPKKRPFSDSPLTRCDLCDLLTHTGLCPRVVPAAQDVSAPDGRGRRRRGRGARAAATTGQGTVDEACCDVFLHAPHVQNSFSVWQKSALAVRFVEQWLRFNEDEEVRDFFSSLHALRCSRVELSVPASFRQFVRDCCYSARTAL